MASKRGKAGRNKAQVLQVQLQGAVRLVLYLLLGGVLFLAEALLVVFIRRTLLYYNPASADVATYAAIALGAVIYLPIFGRLRRALDKVLYHDTYELSAVLQDYSQRFGSLSDH